MTTPDQWYWAHDAYGVVRAKSTNHAYILEVARLKGWTVQLMPDGIQKRERYDN